MRSVLGEASADQYLDELVVQLRDDLGERLVGAWLVNSGARDDYLPGRSDLDVVVCATEALDAATKGRLAGALRHAALPCPAPRLELVVYRRSVLAAPGGQPPFELNLNTGPAIADHVTTDPADEPPHWFVLDLSAARERACAMVGPPLDELLAPIPDAVVIEALRALDAWHHLNDTAAPNRVLNACRAWRWIEQRRWWSKTEAAEWAVAAGGDAELIRLAMARRRGETRTTLPADRVEAFSAALDARLARAAAWR
jgi:hypothetical protein